MNINQDLHIEQVHLKSHCSRFLLISIVEIYEMHIKISMLLECKTFIGLHRHMTKEQVHSHGVIL